MEITKESINNNLDKLLKSDHLSIDENIILDSNIWKNAVATHITFDDEYNQPLHKDIFPLATHITFGFYYNQPLDKDIFPLAAHITFGYNYNQPLDKDIFPLAIDITFGWIYDKPITKICNKITMSGYNMKKHPDIIICKNTIIDNMDQYDLLMEIYLYLIIYYNSIQM